MENISEMSDEELLTLPIDNDISSLSDEELRALLPDEEEIKPDQPPINLTVELKPEIIINESESKAEDSKIMVAMLKAMKFNQERLLLEASKEPVTVDNTAINAIVAALKTTNERITTKRQWKFDIIRTDGGDLSEIIATEL